MLTPTAPTTPPTAIDPAAFRETLASVARLLPKGASVVLSIHDAEIVDVLVALGGRRRIHTHDRLIGRETPPVTFEAATLDVDGVEFSSQFDRDARTEEIDVLKTHGREPLTSGRSVSISVAVGQ